MKIRVCKFCKQARQAETMRKAVGRSGKTFWCCADCPKNATTPADEVLGRMRVLRRLPCVAGEDDLGRVSLKGVTLCV